MKREIIKGDFLALAKELPDNCIDIAICDPPYNLSKGNNWSWDSTAGLPGFGGDWNKVMQNWDDMTFEEYFHFTAAWLKEVARLVKPEGSFWVHGTYHNIGVVNVVLQLLGIEIINEVAWYKRNSFPNLSGRRLTASHETILWAHTGKNRKYTFNYEFSKQFFDEADLLKKRDKQMRTVWDIPNNKTSAELSHGKHPTQKPLKLLERMIRLSAPEGEDIVVLSPFLGSGSDCIAAHNLGLGYLGYEIEEEYYSLAMRRIAALDLCPKQLDLAA
jgi:site-specific DNA-methyltransferase (adenine-specific)